MGATAHAPLPAGATTRQAVAYAQQRLAGRVVIAAGFDAPEVGHIGRFLDLLGGSLVIADHPAAVLSEVGRAAAVIATTASATGPGGILARLAAAGLRVPVIVACTNAAAHLAAITSGGTAAVPCDPALLVATAAQHAAPSRAATVDLASAADPVHVDERSRDAWVTGRPVGLTRLEFDILAALGRSPGSVLSHHALAQAAWPSGAASLQAVTEAVRRVRSKLAQSGAVDVVRTHRRSGWSVAAADRTAAARADGAAGGLPQGWAAVAAGA